MTTRPKTTNNFFLPRLFIIAPIQSEKMNTPIEYIPKINPISYWLYPGIKSRENVGKKLEIIELFEQETNSPQYITTKSQSHPLRAILVFSGLLSWLGFFLL